MSIHRYRMDYRKSKWYVNVLLLLMLSLFLLPYTVSAQLPTATILGVVKDSTAAVIPGATLTARNVETGQIRTAITSGDGTYRMPALPVGNYEVRVEHPGFQTDVRRGLTLAVSEEAVVNFALQVGSMAETVSVTAEAPLVNTTTGSLGGLVGEQKVADLPLNGRNYIDLTFLQPGVQQHVNKSSAGANTGTWFSSNGAPLRSNNYLLDGASMANIIGAAPASISGSTLGVEGIREYRVVTNFFSAEYGMTMGSQMLIVTKGGTNNFHGSVFEYIRNSAMDARNFFDLKTLATPRRLPAFTRNNFGASAGGPIRKDKAFFFGVYEGLRERLGITTVSNVIPASAKVDGGLVPQIAPVIKPLLTLYPDPNLPRNQFTFPFSQPTTEDFGQMRVDQNFSANDTIFGRHTVDNTDQIRPLAFPQFSVIGGSRSQFATLSENHVFSPSLLNTIRFSYSRTNVHTTSPSGLIGPQFSFVPGLDSGTINIGGVTTLGPNATSPSLYKQNIFTWSDDLFYTRGRHSLKFGTLINRYQQYILASGANYRGTVTFASISSFLLGQATNYIATTQGSILDRTYFYTTLGFYGEDDYHVSSRLTLNLGLRYEFLTQPHEVRGHGAALRDVQHDANTTLGVPFLNPSLKNFSPRLGFAWDVHGDGKTAVRGGFGLLYDIGNFGSAFTIGGAATPPFSTQSSVVNPATFTVPFSFPPNAVGKALRTLDYLIPQTHLLQYNLTVERQLPWSTAVTVAYGGSRGIQIIRTVEGNPTVPQILADGRQFWPVNPPRTNPNWGTIEYKTGGGNSWYNSLQIGITKRLSKGLQFQSSYTWAKVIDETQGQFGGDDNATSVFGTDPTHRQVDRGPADFDVTHNWRFNTIYQLPAPVSGGILGKALTGWRVSGILSLQTGYPFTVALNANRSRSGVNGGGGGIDRPDLVPGRKNGNIVSGTTAGCLGVAPGLKLGTPTLYFDPCAFTIPAAGFLGTAGRNSLFGPGLANLDFSLVKDTALKSLGESGKLEFRAEIFNLLNHANFVIPSRIVFGATQNTEAPLPNASVITSTAVAARQIQLALKIMF
jgi:outer membrane receptor protein involved in Fe transport